MRSCCVWDDLSPQVSELVLCLFPQQVVLSLYLLSCCFGADFLSPVFSTAAPIPPLLWDLQHVVDPVSGCMISEGCGATPLLFRLWGFQYMVDPISTFWVM